MPAYEANGEDFGDVADFGDSGDFGDFGSDIAAVEPRAPAACSESVTVPLGRSVGRNCGMVRRVHKQIEKDATNLQRSRSQHPLR